MAPAVNQTTVESLAAQVRACRAEIAWLKRVVASAFLCSKDVMARYRWSKPTFYRRRRLPGFPAPRRFAGNLWLLSDLEAAEQAGQLPSPSGGQA